MNESCKTRYPLVLVHGMGFRDNKHINYWGRIPRVLEESGACVFYGNQDSNASVETNALQIKSSIEEVLKSANTEKVNIIAHSKGGLDVRYMISNLGMADNVASLSTISTPHNGSLAIDKLLRFPSFLVKTVAFFTDVWFKILGDKHPDTYRVFKQFSTAYAKEFNINNPDMPQVYYQSFGFVMKNAFSDVLLLPQYLFVHKVEGENDGLLAPRAVKWTNFMGVYRGAGRRGISHCDEVDMRRHRLSRAINENISDITIFYQSVVEKLLQQGL